MNLQFGINICTLTTSVRDSTKITYPIHQLSCMFKMLVNWRVSYILKLRLSLLKYLLVLTLEKKKQTEKDIPMLFQRRVGQWKHDFRNKLQQNHGRIIAYVHLTYLQTKTSCKCSMQDGTSTWRKQWKFQIFIILKLDLESLEKLLWSW